MCFLEEIISLIFLFTVKYFHLLCSNYLWWNFFSCHLLFLFPSSILILIYFCWYYVGSFFRTRFWKRRVFPRFPICRKLCGRRPCAVLQAGEVLYMNLIFFLMNSISQVILVMVCLVFYNIRNFFSWLLWGKLPPADTPCLRYSSLSPASSSSLEAN